MADKPTAHPGGFRPHPEQNAGGRYAVGNPDTGFIGNVPSLGIGMKLMESKLLGKQG
jgi:hypothetical protein